MCVGCVCWHFCRALEDALLGVTEVEIPETLIVEQAREKFAIMMTEFKDQGESDEKIQKMINKEVCTFVRPKALRRPDDRQSFSRRMLAV